MEPSLELAILLLAAAVFVLILELFLPAAGTLLFIAVCCLIGSLTVAFMVSKSTGMTMSVVVLGLLIAIPTVGFEIWKRSPIGQRMFLPAPIPDSQATPGEESALVVALESERQQLVGKRGNTLTPHRPSGHTLIDNQRWDTVSEGFMIPANTEVHVVAVEGHRVVIRLVEDEPVGPDPLKPHLEHFDFEADLPPRN